ncbi:conserved hypothetical protein [Sporisorium reilianum SRZ2]|uniref:CLASP N-terminal domain-containing protein n=1 Tax=Sporisorium reilianum (strain SRZ2) TaxID=999809 RepID=E6ZUS9_SPORE|nr:conserved hypothetical protein [Sporisorium reilianum SRZ2]
MPSRTLASDAKINIASVSDLHSHFDELYDDLHASETEHTWQKIERALAHIQAITRGGATKYAEFVALLKDAAAPINNALLSERTKLSGTAGDLMNSIAPRMAERFEPLVSVFVPTLLLICARTNKVAVKRAEKSLHFIVKHCRPPSVVAYLKEAIKDKGQGLRAVAAATLEVVLEHTEKERLARRVGDIEACIKSGATDSNPEVRQTTKRLFELYVSIWPERVEQFTKPMTPTIRRYLSLPKTGALIVEVPPLIEASASTKSSHASRPPPTQHSSRQDDMLVPTSHAPPSRSAPTPAYNFFPDLTKSAASSSSAARTQTGPGGFNMNDASYGKRGLFADQIAAARNARLARMPSFNFDDLPKSSSDNAPTMKRQPSFDQLRTQPSAPGATFRVPRFDVVAAPTSSDGRPRSAHASEAAQYRDINANTPAFAAASGLHGKSALLAAYKQAFAVESGGAKQNSSSASRDKPSKHSDKRREKTVAVRFDSDSKHDEPVPESCADELRRSKSAPQIHIDKAQHKSSEADNDAKASRAEATDWADSDDDDEAKRPSTPPERILHAQTPRTGVKASRVPAQRVAVPSAVKVSAMRVAVPTPSAKVAAGRVAASSVSAESSPSGKARVLATQEGEAKESPVQSGVQEKADVQAKAVDGKETAAAKTKEEAKVKPTAAVAKKPATSTVAPAKQPVKAVAAKPAPSASIAAKARLAARAASRPATTTTAAATTTAESKKVTARPVSTAAKPAVVRKPVSSTTAAAKPVAKPAAASSTLKTTKPTAAPSTAAARPKPTTSHKPATTKPPNPVVRTSTFMAPTASTRNKIVPAAAVKKFQPKPSTSSAGARIKSSIAASLAAKGRVLGAPAAKDRANAVRKAAGATVVKVREGRRVSAAAMVAVATATATAMQDVVVEAAEGIPEGEAVAVPQLTDAGVADGEAVGLQEAATSGFIVESDSTTDPAPVNELTAEQSSISTSSPDSSTSQAQTDAEEEHHPTAAEDESQSTEAAASATSATPTPAKQPIATPPTPIRTPLGSKDTNVPRSATPLTTKPTSSPLHPTSHLKLTTLSSPLRRTTSSPLKPLLSQLAADASSSFEESDSESDEEDTEQVVQLHFGLRTVGNAAAQQVAHKVVSAGGKQLVLGVDSSDDSGVMEAGAGDETVLLEHAM